MWRSLVGLAAVLMMATACAGTQETSGETGVGGSGEAAQQEDTQSAQNQQQDGGDGQAAPTEDVQSQDMASDSQDGGQASGENGDGSMAGAEQQTAKPGTKTDFVQSVQDRVFFGFDQSSLTQQAQRTLRNQAQWLQDYPQVQITIQGHTDERGTRDYNLALGKRRASAVRDYLVAQGVAADRIETVSYGEERPAVEGSNEWAWAQNRRAVTLVEGRVTGS